MTKARKETITKVAEMVGWMLRDPKSRQPMLNALGVVLEENMNKKQLASARKLDRESK